MFSKLQIIWPRIKYLFIYKTGIIEGLNNRLLFISAFDIYIAIITNIIKKNLSCIININ